MKTIIENLKALDRMCISHFGMSYGDMPDLTFVADLFEDGHDVGEVFEICCDDWADQDSLFREVRTVCGF